MTLLCADMLVEEDELPEEATRWMALARVHTNRMDGSGGDGDGAQICHGGLSEHFAAMVISMKTNPSPLASIATYR